MRLIFRGLSILFVQAFFLAIIVSAQLGNSGSIEGIVKDPSGAVVPGATVQIANPVSGLTRSAVTDAEGIFHFTNVPFNPYHLTASSTGFVTSSLDVEVRSSVPTRVTVELNLGTAATTVNVTENGGDLVEKDPSFHTDVDTSLTDRLPLESQSSSVSSLITLVSPAWWQTPTGCSTGLGIMPKTPFPWMASPSRISKAKFSPTRFRWIRFSPSKLSLAVHRQNMATRRVW